MRRLIFIYICFFLSLGINAQSVYPGYIDDGYNESDARHLLVKRFQNGVNEPMEGIWQSNTGMKFFIVGCYPKGQVYCGTHSKEFMFYRDGLMIVVLDSDNEYWCNGCIKGYIEKTQNDNVYSMTHYAKSSLGRSFKDFKKETLLLIQDSPNTAYYTRPNRETIKLFKIFSASNTSTYESSQQISKQWSGTGFFLSKNGYIITNQHVIDGAKTIKVTSINGNHSTSYSARIEVSDKQNDLAIIKITDNFTTPTIPYSFKFSQSSVGENCWVLGYPLTQTMGEDIKLTNGIISSKSGFDGNIAQYQISAPVQPGNSGGPVFDNNGNLIGVVQAKHGAAENAGYAVKASYVKNLIDMLPNSITLPQTNMLSGKSLPQQVELASKCVVLIICE